MDIPSHINPTFLNGYNVLDQYKHLSVPEIKQIADRDRLDFTVLCLNLEKDLNIANIIRSAHLLGAKKVYTLGWNRVDHRGMVGCQNYTDIEKIRIPKESSNLDICKEISKIWDKDGYQPVFVELTNSSKSFRDRSFKKICKKKPMLIFGNEGLGIPEEIIDYFTGPRTFHIPQLGVIRSMNVSSAASIVMAETNRILTQSWFRSLF